MEVKSLDNYVKSNIRSGYCINNVAQCVNELVLNSLDAKSTHIAVRVSLISFRIQVVDDGVGIIQSNLEHIGKFNYTNKCESLHDLEKNRKIFGIKGEALASISNNSKLIKITTRPWSTSDSQTCSKTFLKCIEGKQHTIVETVERASEGTTVTIQEFLYNLPIRQKRTKNMEFNDIITNMQRLFILHPHVTFSLRDDSNRKILFSSSAVDTAEIALRQQIGNIDEQLVKYYTMTRGRTSVKVLIYLKEYEDSNWQMFYVNQLPIKSTELRNFVNKILSRSALGQTSKINKTNNSHARPAANYLYLFNVICPRSKYQLVNFNEVEFKNLDSVFKLIERQLMKIIEKEKLHLEIDKKKTTVEFKLEHRIQLSGFPGALKASAIRETNNAENLFDSISNHVDTFSKIGQHKTSSKIDKQNTPKCNNAEIETQHCIIEQNYKINAIKPLETTSTIGKNYVLKKFLHSNANKQDIKNDLKCSKEMYKMEHYKETRKRHLEIDEAHEVSIYQRKKPMLKIGNEDMSRNYYPNTNIVGISYLPDRTERNMRYQNENDALQLPNEANDNFKYEYRAISRNYRNAEMAFDLGNVKQHETYKRNFDFLRFHCPFEPIPIMNDIRTSFKKPICKDIPQRWQVSETHKYCEDTFRRRNTHLPCGFRGLRKENLSDNASLFNLSRDLHGSDGYNLQDINYANDIYENQLPREKKFDFEEIDAKLFNLSFKCRRTPGQVFSFGKTVCDHDLSSDQQFITHVPEERRKQTDFFRILASEKFTRFKQSKQTGINKGLKATTKAATTSNTMTVNAKSKTLTSCHSKRTTVTYISHSKYYEKTEVTRKMKKRRNKSNECECNMNKLLNKLSGRKRKIKMKADKSVLKQFNVDSCVVQHDESVALIDQSIQCSINNFEINCDLSGIDKKSIELKSGFNNNMFKPIQDPSLTSSEKISSNITIHYVCNLVGNCIEDIQINTNIDDIIEGTPQNASTPLKSCMYQSICKTLHKRKSTEPKILNDAKLSLKKCDNETHVSEQEKKRDLLDTSDFENDAHLMFNLSQAINELAEDWSFQYVPNNNENKCPIELSDHTRTLPSNTKKRIFPSDIFDGLFLNTHKNFTSSEWSRKMDFQGSSYYINKRTGNIMTQIPQDQERFNLSKRPSDLPKGFSQTFKITPCVTETISKDTKRNFHAAVCESYENDDLADVKWKKYYLQSTGFEDFFKHIYNKRFIIDEQNEIKLPNMRQSKVYDSVVYTKDMFHQVNVLRQYDRKFIVAVWKPKKMIVIFDQHAVHERIRLEELIRKYIQIGADDTIQMTSTIIKSFELSCNSKVIKVCQTYLGVFNKLGLDIICKNDDFIVVKSVPECVFNKALRESARRKEKLVELTKSLIYEVVNSISDAVSFNQWVPPLLVNLTNSEACRGAVKFGDALTVEECGKFIQDLATCDLPFQCAHGRPTCVPLMKLNNNAEVHRRINLERLKFVQIN